MTTLKFPEGFIWGVAASAYQIEGAWNGDGRSESIWDRDTQTSYHVLNGENASCACDHHHSMPKDIAPRRTFKRYMKPSKPARM
ncbi:MAG: family 1 glycosylhydrolase [Anaerolineales bacterium]|nr:family 1 glycosylhydrolase [Anaerolineales bacterium]MCB9111409.1 family 1 glycosylhydrolase [Anaerolineales bacterium]